jgi:hypothetical protein
MKQMSREAFDKLGLIGFQNHPVPCHSPQSAPKMVTFEHRRAPFDKLRAVGKWNRKRRKLPFAGRNGANGKALVEPRGIEPLTSSLRTTRSPS